jgi:hypothetical protein
VVSLVKSWSSQPGPTPEIASDRRKPAPSPRRYQSARSLATLSYTTKRDMTFKISAIADRFDSTLPRRSSAITITPTMLNHLDVSMEHGQLDGRPEASCTFAVMNQ